MSDHELTTQDRSHYNTLAANRKIGEQLFESIKAQPATATTVMTAAEVLALDSTPIELVAAPGANKAVVPVKVVIFQDYGTVVFGGTSTNFRVRYVGGTTNYWAGSTLSGFANLAEDAMVQYYDGATTQPAPELNTALECLIQPTALTDGTGTTWTVKVFYHVLDFTIIGGQ